MLRVQLIADIILLAIQLLLLHVQIGLLELQALQLTERPNEVGHLIFGRPLLVRAEALHHLSVDVEIDRVELDLDLQNLYVRRDCSDHGRARFVPQHVMPQIHLADASVLPKRVRQRHAALVVDAAGL